MKIVENHCFHQYSDRISTIEKRFFSFDFQDLSQARVLTVRETWLLEVLEEKERVTIRILWCCKFFRSTKNPPIFEINVLDPLQILCDIKILGICSITQQNLNENIKINFWEIQFWTFPRPNFQCYQTARWIKNSTAFYSKIISVVPCTIKRTHNRQ